MEMKRLKARQFKMCRVHYIKGIKIFNIEKIVRVLVEIMRIRRMKYS